MDHTEKILVYGKDNESANRVYCQVVENANIGVGTSVGIRPKANEDCLGVSILEEEIIFAIADGHWGREASEFAVVRATGMLDPDVRRPKDGEPRARLYALNEQINSTLFEMGMAYAGAPTPETTLIVCHLMETATGKVLYWSSFGDSFLFVIRKGEMKQLNSLNPRWLGFLSKLSENAQTGGLYTRYVTGKTSYTGVADGLETGIERLMPGDIIFLCTDGLTGFDTDTDLDERTLKSLKTVLLKELSIEDKTGMLIRGALQRGETDNISCIVAQII